MATGTEIIVLAGTVSPRHSHCLHYAGNENEGVTGSLWQSFCGMLAVFFHLEACASYGCRPAMTGGSHDQRHPSP
jgi:hypothetical protein